MTAGRTALQENLLNNVNGGIYIDPKNMLVGKSANGQLYKFVSEKDCSGTLFSLMVASFLGADLDDDEALTGLFNFIVEKGWAVPYNG